ncbi:MAG TPA: anhydro-N-acetylmuramic acid kinase, partial [Longimicrobiaceae bacterium]|nr:anhydro-N-acetylmuramic acid kinase [Longimicrobiaceae bacterium]
YPEERRAAIHAAIVAGTAETLCGVHAELGEWLAEAVLRLCAEAGVAPEDLAAVGSHGQTVWHRPPAAERRGATLQLGDAATVAERTGCAVVSDFRARDVAAGGHGAPLVPWVERLLFAAEGRARALQNIGGIGNVTRVPARGSDEPLLAFDTGPGNALIDAAVELATGGRLTYDRDGRLAVQGTVDQTLLAELLRHPYLAVEPPKSTGREEFGRPFVERLVEAMRPEGDRDWLDLVATLTELTARSIADAYGRWVIPRGIGEVVVSGGGARNPALMARLGELLAPLPVRDGSALGMDPDAKEAVAFALLAWAHLHGIPANAPDATGAAGPRVLGSLTPGVRGVPGFSYLTTAGR